MTVIIILCTFVWNTKQFTY